MNAIVYFWGGFYWTGFELETFYFVYELENKKFREKNEPSARHGNHVGLIKAKVFSFCKRELR